MGDSALAQDTPEAMLAECTAVRSQRGIKVVNYARTDRRTGFDCMWHLRHSPKRFAVLADQAGLHRCKKNQRIWQRSDVIQAFHLEAVPLTRYSEFCGRDPAEFVLVSPDRRGSYYFTTVF